MKPVSEERLREIGSIYICHDHDSPAAGVAFRELLAEVYRLRDMPPEVAAAMERYAATKGYDGFGTDLHTIADYFTQLFQK